MDGEVGRVGFTLSAGDTCLFRFPLLVEHCESIAQHIFRLRRLFPLGRLVSERRSNAIVQHYEVALS